MYKWNNLLAAIIFRYLNPSPDQFGEVIREFEGLGAGELARLRAIALRTDFKPSHCSRISDRFSQDEKILCLVVWLAQRKQQKNSDETEIIRYANLWRSWLEEQFEAFSLWPRTIRRGFSIRTDTTSNGDLVGENPYETIRCLAEFGRDLKARNQSEIEASLSNLRVAKRTANAAFDLQKIENEYTRKIAVELLATIVAIEPRAIDGRRLELFDTIYPRFFYYRPTPGELREMIKQIEQVKYKSFDSKASLLSRALQWSAPQMRAQIAAWQKDRKCQIDISSPSYNLVGLSVTKTGQFRRLYYDPCYALEVVEKVGKKDKIVGPFELNSVCDNCDLPLFACLSIALDGDFRHLRKIGDRITVPICPECLDQGRICYGHAAERPGKAIRGGYGLVLNRRRWSPIRSLHLFGSHIGGLPKWCQDPAYPRCPDCKKRMKFLAKISGWYMDWTADDIFVCVCESCKTTAARSQRT